MGLQQKAAVPEANATVRGTPGTSNPPDRSALEMHLDWASGITDDEWEVYQSAIIALRRAGVPFMLGGGFAHAAFTGRWRNTKDIDFYTLPSDRDLAVKALTAAGFDDYYSTLAYDRAWIYRSVKRGVIVDIIWAMANQRAQVDAIWLERAGRISIRGEQIHLLPIEEFAWCKMYIVQRDRCDWIDVLNLFYCNGPGIDWDHLILRLGPDVPLLRSLLTLYAWLHPERASLLPEDLLDRLGLRPPVLDDADKWRDRVRFLDSRQWFSGLKPRGERMEV